MKHLIKLAATLLAVMFVFTACATPSDSPASADTSAPAAQTTAPSAATDNEPVDTAPVEETIQSEDFYGIYTSEIGTLNHLVTNKSVDADAIAAFCDPLILVNKDGGFEPGMATEWTQSADGLTWTLKIREGVQWQRWDGSDYAEITAQDWVDAIEYILDPTLGSLTVDFVLDFIAGARDYYDAVDAGAPADFSSVGVKAPDAYTLEYTTTEIFPFFPSLLSYSCYLPVSKQFIEEIGGIEAFGSEKDLYLYYGEYLFQDWLIDQEWTFVKNEKYYLADRVHVGLRNYVMVQDSKVALEMYKRGEVSSATVLADQFDSAMADPELSPYVFRSRVSAASWYYYYNHGSANTNTQTAVLNVNFRKAVMSSLDRTTLLSISNKSDPGYLRRNTLNIWGLSVDENGKDYMEYDKLQEIENRDSYDPDAVTAYIAAAKEELGDTVTWPVTIKMAVQNTEASMTTGEATKQCIEAATNGDVTVDIWTYAAEDYYKVQEEGNFDLTSGGWIPDYADPASYLEINQLNGYIGGRNSFSLVPEWVIFDEMVAEAKTKSVLSERFQLLAEAEVYAIEQALVIPYRASGGNYAISNIQNPQDSLEYIAYGLCNSKWLDRYYGTTPLTTEERAALMGN